MAHWPALLAAGAWVLLIGTVVWRFRDTRSLDDYPAESGQDAPLVSIVIPARDEARNIERCVRAALAARYPALEVIVVDDHSADGTGDIARRLAAEDVATRGTGWPPRVRVLDAPALPSGWFGKQWACHTGARAARGTLLCFSDADTAHGPELLARSVNALRTRSADLFTVAGQQEMGSFWEKVVQPTVFALLLARYGGLEGMSRSTRPMDKIANGQFMLVGREAYERIGGHEAVRDHVAEDLMLAQRFTAAGLGVHMVLARDHLTTRMYTSLDEIRRGWGKNIFAAGRDTVSLGPITGRVFPFIFPIAPLMPLLPTSVFALASFGALGEGAWWFGAIAGSANLLYWFLVYGFSRLSPLWALLHPLGCLVFGLICVEAAWRGSEVEWKGRRYGSRETREGRRETGQERRETNGPG